MSSDASSAQQHHQQQQQQQQQQLNMAALAAGGLSGAAFDPTTAAPALHPQLAHPQMQLIQQFWAQQIAAVENGEIDYRTHQLPLARIKKVMKTDEEVRNKMMISAEAPILFAKACEIFILELTMRAWIHTEENKRRTLQRSDIATAISKTDVFDFLIDVVPREDMMKAGGKKLEGTMADPAMMYSQMYGRSMGVQSGADDSNQTTSPPPTQP